MTLIFLYQDYKQQPSIKQNDVFENVLCDVYECKAFGRTFLKYKPVQNELLDINNSDSTGDIDSTATDEI